MATPIVHASLGLVVASTALIASKPLQQSVMTSGKNLFLYVFSAIILACLPDIDIPASYILTGDVRTFHFGITHTLFFCITVALAIRIKFSLYYTCWAFSLVLSHVLVDSFTGKAFGVSETAGIQPFLPFSDYVFVSNLTLFPGVEHSNWWSKHNMLRVLYDTMLFVPLAASSIYLATRIAEQQSPELQKAHLWKH